MHLYAACMLQPLYCVLLENTESAIFSSQAAQVFKCFAEHCKSSPLVAGAPFQVQPDELQLSFQMQQQAAFDAVPLDPRSCPGTGM